MDFTSWKANLIAREQSYMDNPEVFKEKATRRLGELEVQFNKMVCETADLLEEMVADGAYQLCYEFIDELIARNKTAQRDMVESFPNELLAVEFGKLFDLIATALPKLKRAIKRHEKESAK
jgi:hypothetical protein